MTITADELNRIADEAFATGKALEAAEAAARKNGQPGLADDCLWTRGRLDDAIRRFWNANSGVLLDPQEMAAISHDLGAAAASVRQAASNLAGLANALNRLSGVIGRILNAISLLKAL